MEGVGDEDFEDRVVLVTGGASGQGEATCRRFAAEELLRKVVADWNADGAARVAREIGGEAFAVNVASEREVKAMVEFTCDRFGGLDVLFNNAGVGHSATDRYRMASIVDTPEDAWDAILDINLKGQAMGCKHALPRMVAGGGGVIDSTTPPSWPSRACRAPMPIRRRRAACSR